MGGPEFGVIVGVCNICLSLGLVFENENVGVLCFFEDDVSVIWIAVGGVGLDILTLVFLLFYLFFF